MDAFFASVEQMDNPKLRGKPLIVGGDPSGRGVVAACSYEARKFGIHSAMACARAIKLCPGAVFVRPRMQRYKEVSQMVMAIFLEYTDLVEPLSLDEAFLDISNNKKNIPSATWVAEAIRKEIFQKTGLTASAGVSSNKFLAKVASDIHKPNGQTVITPEEAVPFIKRLPIGKFFGVGKVTEKKMHSMGIYTGADLKKFSKQDLLLHFGKSGTFFYDIVRGNDQRSVNPERVRNSIGSEVTLKEDVSRLEDIRDVLRNLSEKLESILQKRKIGGFTITLKVRYSDFTTVTRSRTTRQLIYTVSEMLQHTVTLLKSTQAGKQKVRLLGISISNLSTDFTSRTVTMYQLKLPFLESKQAVKSDS